MKRSILHEGHRTQRKILNTLIEHVVYHDMDMRVLWANKAACQSVDMGLEQVIGRHCYEIWPKRATPCEDCPVSRSRETGQPQSKEIKTPDGRCWQISASPVFDAHGRIEAMVELTLDITERVQATDALKKIQNEQEQLIKERTHDLVRVNEQLRQEIEERKKTEAVLREQKDYIQQLAMELSSAEERERRRLAGILHDDLQQILAYLKLQLATQFSHKSEEENVDNLIRIIDDGLDRCRNLAHEMNPTILKEKDLTSALQWLCLQMQDRHGLTVDLQTTAALHIQSSVLLSMLIRSIRELLFNVVKHSDEKRASVTVRVVRDRLRITIADAGNGCDLAVLKNKQTRGNVFGLFHIEDRIKFLGGGVRIESTPGRGFCVKLDVPRDVSPSSKRTQKMPADAAVTEPKSEVPAAFAKPDWQKSSIRILIAEGHELMREGLAKMLAELESIVVVGRAADGQEALEMAAKLTPDVVLMDVSMPILDGIEATAEIRARLPNIRVIGLAIHQNSDTLQAMLDAGACACLSKTSSPEELVANIRRSSSNQPKRPRNGARETGSNLDL